MNKQFEMVGRKIKEHSHLLTENTSNIFSAEISPSFYTSCKEKYGNWLELYFQSIGDYLTYCPYTAQKNIFTCADIYGQKSVDFEVPLDKSLYFFVHTRTVIFDFLFEEVESLHISAKTILHAIKMINQLIDQATIAFIMHYKKSLSKTKYALEESSEDLKITLKDLNNLKKAMNETTIFSITDKNDTIIYANDKFCDITKYTKEELIGQNHDKMLNSGFHPKEFFEDVVKTLKQGEIWNGEIKNKAKDGTCYWVESTLIPFLDNGGETYHFSIQKDITEQKRTEDLLRKMEKLSLVGEMAAGIAHEIRNPLTAIKGFVQLLSQSSENRDFPYSSIILGEIDRINQIVSEFMVFAKPHTTDFNKCNVSEILSSVIHLLNAEVALKNIMITHHFSSDNLNIFGDKHQLQQVFLNILKNAIEALPDGGHIHVSATTEGQNIRISIQDDGVGMSCEQIERLGEPFYTTKETGNGLGLMVSYKIIQNHKGTISVRSDVASGTNFTIIFPLLKNEDALH